MRRATLWLVGVFVLGMFAGSQLIPLTGAAAQADEKVVKVKNHWRHHDGHWSYWHEPDRRWYYTNGTNWYYQSDDDDGWRVYRFDKGFGREDFERGEYRLPDEGIKIELPRFKIYRRR